MLKDKELSKLFLDRLSKMKVSRFNDLSLFTLMNAHELQKNSKTKYVDQILGKLRKELRNGM